MKLVVTGASGFVGRQLVPLLSRAGVDVVLVGRDEAALARLFPGYRTSTYENVSELRGFEALLHLATLNSNARASADAFAKANVELTLRTSAAAQQAGIKHFIFVSSFHALDPGASHQYAISKITAAERLQLSPGQWLTILYLPAVYGETFSGRWAALNRLPPTLRVLFLPLLRALSPMVSIDTLADALIGLLQGGPRGRVLAATRDHVWLYELTSRSLDVAVSVALLVFGLPLMALIALVICLTSPGPALFKQDRVGRNGRIFPCLKFRTMRHGVANVATHEASPSDVTPVGRWLRKTKLDELPQCVNVLLGQMSLIGPRPCLPSQTTLVEHRKRRGVLTVRPGITGLAQIRKVDMSEPERLAMLDEQYVAMRSLALDARILVSTLRGHGSGDKLRTIR